MKFETTKENLLDPLQKVVGIIEKKQTMPILSNALLTAEDKDLSLTGTDLEIELITKAKVDTKISGRITIPGKKLMDICRYLPDQSLIVIEAKEQKVLIQSGHSQFVLSTLDADMYPAFSYRQYDKTTLLSGQSLKKALEKTLFCIGKEDVRSYLNGLKIELNQDSVRVIGSDGHRLAIYEFSLIEPIDEPVEFIIPRKSAFELYKLFDDSDVAAKLEVASNSIKIKTNAFCFSTKLIEGRYPNYLNAFPKDIEKCVKIDKSEFKYALNRLSVLASDYSHSINMSINGDELKINGKNTQEKGEEIISLNYNGDAFSVGFNYYYLIEVIAHIDDEIVQISFGNIRKSCLIEDNKDSNVKFLIMPVQF